ncbi:MAG: hypothetical protein JXR95_09060 [Deltaproteobacteria bacterium]|nr:hypothetical protein [Deltaproteobacteria bacterium]
MTKVLDTVLLLALPASGKSEVRKYLEGLTHEQCATDFHMGETLQLDDYPYVHFMHRIDDELHARGQSYVFYKGPDRPFQNDFEWGTLIELLNEDYDDLMAGRITKVPSASQHLFDRLDCAREKSGLEPALGMIPYKIRCEIAAVMEEEVAEELAQKNKTCSMERKGRTVVIEAARGGPNGSAFPLTPPHGYQYSLSKFSNAILDGAGILYVKVTPDESRKKNIERGKPDGQGSILHHSVPMEVMLGQYGCDDMEYLLSVTDIPNTVKIERLEVEKDGDESRYVMKKWNLPLGVFDNTDDLTTFIRKPRDKWEDGEVSSIHNGLKSAFDILASRTF